MSVNKGKAASGALLLVAFAAVLIVMFMPIFNGQNTLQYMDDLYNSISKGSAYYIPAVKEENAAVVGTAVSATLAMGSAEEAELAALLYQRSGAEAVVSGSEIRVSGDLGTILESSLVDADIMYNNRGEELQEKYGREARMTLFCWWKSLKAMEKDLTRQKQFAEAKAVGLVMGKAVETSYNYYGVEPQKIKDRIGIVIASLAFYVIYTLWYGFAIMFVFEGIGLNLGH